MNEFEKISIETREALKSLHKLFPANPSPEDSPWGFLEGLRLEILDLQVQIKSFEEKLGPKVRAALEQLKKDFPEIKYSAEDPIDYLLNLADHLRHKLRAKDARHQEILKEIGKIGLEDEKEKQELRDLQVQTKCKIQALELAIQLQEAKEGDGWQAKAKEWFENGNCPVCFASDEEGHKPGCEWNEWNEIEQEYQKTIDERKVEIAGLRRSNEGLKELAKSRLESLTQLAGEFAKALSDSQEKLERMEGKPERLQKARELEHVAYKISKAWSTSSEYLVVQGHGRGFETQCSTAMANGWRPQGGIAVKSNGELNQAFVR